MAMSVKWGALLDCGHWTHGDNHEYMTPELGWVLPCGACDLKLRTVIDLVDTRPQVGVDGKRY